MASSDVIKEFLISLGFSIDENGLRKFTRTLIVAAEPIAKLGAVSVTTGLAVEAMVARVSDQMEKLYYQSQRTGATVASLQAIQYGAGQIGLTASAVTGAVEGLARAMRSNPGVTALINEFGVKTAGRDPTAVLHDLVAKLSALPFSVAARFAELFGIDADLLLQLEQNSDKFDEAKAKYTKQQQEAGINPEQLASDARDFNNALRDLEASLDILGQRLLIDFIGPAKDVVEGATAVVTWFNKLDNATNGLAGKLFVIATALGAIKAAAIALKAVGIGGGAAAAAEAGAGGTAVKAATRSGLLRWLGPLGFGLEAFWGGGLNEGEEDFMKNQRALGLDLGSASPGSAPIGMRQNNPGNLRTWDGVPTENGFAHFQTLQAGLGAMTRQLGLYGDRGWNTLSKIINRYAPKGDGKNNPDAYISELSRGSGWAPDTQLDLHDPATLKTLEKLMVTHEQGYNPFQDSFYDTVIGGKTTGGSGGGGGANVTMSQKTSIIVQGSGDPTGTASAVAASQQRVNGDMVRQLESNVR